MVTPFIRFKPWLKIGLLSGFLLNLFLVQVPVFSQNQAPSSPNPDELPDEPQQLKTWYCSQGNQAVLVEVKELKGWQNIIETKGWQCVEQLADIPDNAPQFSCESEEVSLDLITTTWLKGENGSRQMKAWINAFEQQKMECTTDETNPFWY